MRQRIDEGLFGRVHGVVDIIGVAGIKPFSAVDDAGWAQVEAVFA